MREGPESARAELTGIKQALPTGEPLTEQETADLAWMDDAKAGGVAALNDSLRLFAGVSATLFGLLVGFFDKARLPVWSMALGCIFLLLTLAASLYGSLPPTFWTVPILEIVREQRRRLYQRKRQWFKTAAVLLFLALTIFFMGVVADFWQAGKASGARPADTNPPAATAQR